MNRNITILNDSFTRSLNNSLSTVGETTSGVNADAAPTPLPLSVDIALKSVMIGVGSVSLLLSSTVLLFFLIRFKGKWTKHLILIVNVIICDIFICIASILSPTAHIVQTQLIEQFLDMLAIGSIPTPQQLGLHRRFTCVNHFADILWDISTNASLFAFALLAIDHLVAVRWSLQHATVISKKWATLSCVISWTVAIILGYVYDMLIETAVVAGMDQQAPSFTTPYCSKRVLYKDAEYSQTDVDDSIYHRNKVIVFSIGVSINILAFLIMFCSYVYIAGVVILVNRRRKRQNKRYRETYQNLKGIGTTLLLLASFMLLYFPQVVLLLSQTSGRIQNIGELWANIFVIAASLSPLADVFIYAARNKEIKKVVCTCKYRSSKEPTASFNKSIEKTSFTAINNRSPSCTKPSGGLPKTLE